jgi:hypothetical protein
LDDIVTVSIISAFSAITDALLSAEALQRESKIAEKAKKIPIKANVRNSFFMMLFIVKRQILLPDYYASMGSLGRIHDY